MAYILITNNCSLNDTSCAISVLRFLPELVEFFNEFRFCEPALPLLVPFSGPCVGVEQKWPMRLGRRECYGASVGRPLGMTLYVS